MLVAKYDYATDIRVQRKEAWEDGEEYGLEQGLEQGFAKGKWEQAVVTARNLINLLEPEVIAQTVGLPLEEVLALKKENPT